MPSSSPHQISPVLEIMLALAPTSVLDVGPGFGKYGVLCREYLDVNRSFHRDTYPPPRQLRLDCIEVHPQYLSPLHHHIYDHAYLGNAVEILPTLPEGSYDLGLAIDVIEHFSPDSGTRFIRELLRVARVALVVTPCLEFPQSEVFGNAHEAHRSRWTPRALGKLAPCRRSFRALSPFIFSHICALSNDPQALAGISAKLWMDKWLLHRTLLLECVHVRGLLRRLRWHRRWHRRLPFGASTKEDPVGGEE